MVEDGYLTADQEAEAKKAQAEIRERRRRAASRSLFRGHGERSPARKVLRNGSPNPELPRLYDTRSRSSARRHQAVQIGMQSVDKLLARRYAVWKKKGQPVPQPQVALVAMDPHTGEIRALVGGRDYGESQLNHALARRQPGSVFKPFVYAAAFDNVVENMQPVVTPMTMLVDEPTTFQFDGKEYTPNNYGEEFYGNVTVRDALMHSLNVATVKVAEMIGYQRVVACCPPDGPGN